MAPNQVRNKKFDINTQKNTLAIGLNVRDFILLVCTKGNDNTITKLATKASRPPNLLGMALNIAYANKKYHSGTMWIGVTSGFDDIKFSASPK